MIAIPKIPSPWPWSTQLRNCNCIPMLPYVGSIKINRKFSLTLRYSYYIHICYTWALEIIWTMSAVHSTSSACRQEHIYLYKYQVLGMKPNIHFRTLVINLPKFGEKKTCIASDKKKLFLSTRLLSTNIQSSVVVR